MSGIAAAGLGITVATTVMSFAEANKQKKSQNEAEKAASEAIASAKKTLEVNHLDDLSINKEAYEMEADRLLAVSNNLIDAGVESERGAGAMAGRIMAKNATGQREIATSMGREMNRLDLISAKEDSRIADQLAHIDTQEAEGAQVAAGRAEYLKNQATQDGFEGVGSALSQGLKSAPLYSLEGRTKGARQANKMERRNKRATKDLSPIDDDLYDIEDPISYGNSGLDYGNSGTV
tara:strand:+ start:10657 stop:11361 length:705 start_codon:yes stop_codon:yes gene_type:complete